MREHALLLDSSALIDLYRGREPVRRIAEATFDRQLLAYFSVISEAELWRGVQPHELGRHEALLAYFTPIPLGSPAARLAGGWMQRYAEQGLGWMDALIVASANMADLPVLTRDHRLARCLEREARFETYRL
jgi:predicted nucleic acid-binding protein